MVTVHVDSAFGSMLLWDSVHVPPGENVTVPVGMLAVPGAWSATVADQAPGTASIPTGTVTFSPGGTCTLSHSSIDPNAESTCTVTITPTATGQLSISAD